jgi:hypothetical protein
LDIKEPKGVDFIIESRPLTISEELAISEYIKNYKLKNSLKKQVSKTTKRKIKTVTV